MDWDSLSRLSREMALCMADASARAALLGIAAFLLSTLLGRRSSAQHVTWTLVLIGMLGLPFLRPLVPATHIPLPRVITRQATHAPSALLAANPQGIPTRVLPSVTVTPARPRAPLWPLLAMAAYLIGAVPFALRLAAGMLWTRRVLRDTRAVDSDLWMYYEMVADTDAYLTLEESDRVRVPLTVGCRHMRVILPADWREFPADRLKSILAHELAHVGRGDPFIALLAAVNKCVFWFHPLAWWLERRLAVLAEHAADEAGVAASSDAASYARLLLDTAARMQIAGSRLIVNTAAMSGPAIAQRIRRVLDEQAGRIKPLGRIASTALLSIGGILFLLAASLDVRPLSAAQAKSSHTPPIVPTAEQVPALEQKLAADPEDEPTRDKLLMYYSRHRMEDSAIPLMLWLIDHHPESPLHNRYSIVLARRPEVVGEAQRRWRIQAALHPNDPRVLTNAASFSYNNPQEEIDLLKRARALDPLQPAETLARFYSSMLAEQPLQRRYPAIAAEVRAELARSNDIALVGSVARYVVERAASATMLHEKGWDFTTARDLATELVTHAQALDPQNRDWSDLMEGVKGLEIGPPTPEAARTTPPAHPTIRVGAAVAASNLKESTPPLYPAEAKAAGIQGVVKLQIHIGADGHVTEATVVSGHPLLVGSAIDAAQHYLYKPILLNGQAAEVVTEVDIPFHQP